MIKTKIGFDEIRAGDLLEVVASVHGVKFTYTGVAFEKVEHGEDSIWQTSQGGGVVTSLEDGDIYRLDVSEVTFEDIRAGDLLEVSAMRGDVELLIRGRAVRFVRSDASWYDGWATEDGTVMVRRRNEDKIVVLERDAK